MEKEQDFAWLCNECNSAELSSSVPEYEIDMELHRCSNCGCLEMHKEFLTNLPPDPSISPNWTQ